MSETDLKALDKAIEAKEKEQRKLSDERVKLKRSAAAVQSELDQLYARREAARKVAGLSEVEREQLRALLA